MNICEERSQLNTNIIKIPINIYVLIKNVYLDNIDEKEPKYIF